MNALGIEPRTYGLKVRCPIILKGIDGKDLEQTKNPTVTPTDTKPQGLHQIIEAWDTLPDAIKSAIRALVEANQPKPTQGSSWSVQGLRRTTRIRKLGKRTR